MDGTTFVIRAAQALTMPETNGEGPSVQSAPVTVTTVNGGPSPGDTVIGVARTSGARRRPVLRIGYYLKEATTSRVVVSEFVL